MRRLWRSCSPRELQASRSAPTATLRGRSQSRIVRDDPLLTRNRANCWDGCPLGVEPRNPGMTYYLIFQRSGLAGHSVVHLARACTPRAAIQRYLQWQSDTLHFAEDGTVAEQWEDQIIQYPHVVAYLEA